MSRLKIVVFLLAVGIAGSIIATAYWYYTRVLRRDTQRQQEITLLQSQKATLPDPGVKRFERAVEQLGANDFEGGRAALYELLRTFPDSTTVPEAKRIIGEMNMDMLFSKEHNTAGKDYPVQPGEGLARIAGKNKTTIECILRANGLHSGRLQPGDRLFVFPLDFEIVVDVSAKTLTLLRGGRFFKEYTAVDMKLPSGMRVPAEMKVGGKSSWFRGKQASVTNNDSSTNPDFMEADKTINAEASRVTFTIRAMPRARPVEAAPAPAPAAATPAKGQGKGKSKKTAEDDALDDLAPEQVVSGIFLPREDIEELYTIIRQQTPVKVVR